MTPDFVTRTVLLVLALSCYGSFIWSILRFFRQNQGMPTRMKIISVTGSISMMAHLTAIGLATNFNVARSAIAVVGYVVSLSVFWWSLRTVWQHRLAIAFSQVEPSELIRHGPYYFVRHPIYFAYTLAWISGSIAVSAWWPWGVVLLMLPQYLLAIHHEEKQFLTGAFADQYRDYSLTTGRLFPKTIKMIRAKRL